MKFIVIGSVKSTEIVIRQAIKNGYKPDHIYGLSKDSSTKVSGYVDLSKVAEEHNVAFTSFEKINDHTEEIREKKPDIIFVVGLSQLVSQEIISAASDCVIGLHPTKLPQFRGRAAIPWQILLGVRESAVSLFQIGEGMDDGDIICQESYEIKKTDYAQDVHNSVEIALMKALDSSMDQIMNGMISLKKQNELEASYLLIRREEDGLINWKDSAENIYDLIRATSSPYPGAFSFYEGEKVVFDKVELVKNDKIFGISGQIAAVYSDSFNVCVGDWIMNVSSYRSENPLHFTVGKKFISDGM